MNLLATESRLNHGSRTPPDVAIADYKAIAEQHFYTLKPWPFVVTRVPFDKDAAHIIGIVDEIGQATIRALHADRVTIGVAQLLQGRQGRGIDAELDCISRARGTPEISRSCGHDLR